MELNLHNIKQYPKIQNAMSVWKNNSNKYVICTRLPSTEIKHEI